MPVEGSVDIWCECPLCEDARRLADREPVDPQRHRTGWPLREVVRLQAYDEARRAHERLPLDGELRALLTAGDVDTHTASGVRLAVTVRRFRSDPRTSADVVEVARRQRDVDRLPDIAAPVGPQRCAVELGAGLPHECAAVVFRAQELLDLDHEMIARPQA